MFGEVTGLIVALTFFMAVDYVTGMIKANFKSVTGKGRNVLTMFLTLMSGR